MKKILSVLLIVVLLLSGCANEDKNYRDVELTDFEYTYSKIETTTIGTLKISPKINIKNLIVTYHLKNYNGIIETNTLNCGDLTADREYSFLFESKPNGFVDNGVEIISATGKINNNDIATERDVELTDIEVNGDLFIKDDYLCFRIKPKVYIKDLSINYKLKIANVDSLGRTSTFNSEWAFTKTFADIVVGTEYEIKSPIYTLPNGQTFLSAFVYSATGKVKN